MADNDSERTMIGPETRISGEIRGEEDLVVRGRVEGRIQLAHTLTVDEGGIVQADVDVRSLVVSGVLVGNIVASESVRLTDKARVIGDVTTPRFVMEAGAAYRGRVEMGETASAGASERRAVASRTAPDRAALAPSRTTQARAATPPPRLASPSAAAAQGARAPAAPVRPALVAPRPAAPPALPRPEAAAASGPAWAKKKLRRR